MDRDATGEILFLLDTGINAKLDQFKGNKITTYQKGEPKDDHGTSVLGCVCSWAFGLVRNIEVVSFDISDENGRPDLNLIESALRKVLAHDKVKKGKKKKVVINLSFTIVWLGITCKKLIREIIDAGHLFVASAGNYERRVISGFQEFPEVLIVGSTSHRNI